jgi:hypothetical protein
MACAAILVVFLVKNKKNLRKDIELSSVKPEISYLFSVFGQVIELSRVLSSLGTLWSSVKS